jgi:cytoskeletal protein RodZ
MRYGNGSPQAEPKIGRSLELARKERGLSLHQVEEETKIRARYLRELERENFDVLPPVYVQGSLKTYANFLGLDGETLTRELKRRQPLEDEPEAPTHVEPPKSEYLDRYLVSLGAADAETREMAGDEEAAGTATVSADNGRLYLASAAFLVLALVAVVLVLTLPRDGQQEVSQVREPLISPAPSEVSRTGDAENDPISQQEDDQSDNRQPEQQAVSPDEDARDDGEPAQGPRDATASSSATPAAETATAEPNATPAPEEPATTQPAPVREDQGVVGALQARGEDEGPVRNFSITREKNATMGDSSCPRRDGGLFEIRRGKKDPGACPAGNVGRDRDNDR